MDNWLNLSAVLGINLTKVRKRSEWWQKVCLIISKINQRSHRTVGNCEWAFILLLWWFFGHRWVIAHNIFAKTQIPVQYSATSHQDSFKAFVICFGVYPFTTTELSGGFTSTSYLFIRTNKIILSNYFIIFSFMILTLRSQTCACLVAKQFISKLLFSVFEKAYFALFYFIYVLIQKSGVFFVTVFTYLNNCLDTKQILFIIINYLKNF